MAFFFCRRGQLSLQCLLILNFWATKCLGRDKLTDILNAHRQEHLVLQNRAPHDKLHEVVFAVRQRNTENIEAELIERSTPESSRYQKWMTFEEVGDYTSNLHGAKTIRKWLSESNATVTWESLHSDYIKATAPIQIWEHLFSTTFHEWEDKGRTEDTPEQSSSSASEETDKPPLLILAKEYTIPAHMLPHVETVFNTVQPPPMLSPRYHLKDQDSLKSNLRANPINHGISTQGFGFAGVSVPFLNAFYKIQSNKGNGSTSQAVFETGGQKFSQKDLRQFQQQFGLPQQPAVDKKGISNTDTCISAAYPDSSNADCYEGNLDLQFLMGIAQQTSTIFWYEATSNPFLTWIVSVSNTKKPPLSNSISWGTVEQMVDVGTMNAFNLEAMKLGLMGVTITVSSGDYGTANVGGSSNPCMCSQVSGSSQSRWQGGTTWKGNGYFPSFPATSPYVTAVGGTQGPDMGIKHEVACQSQAPYNGVITTGGGFSSYYPQPSWQKPAVEKYFSGLDSSNYPVAGYNIKGRGYPDISLFAMNYQIVVGGAFIGVYGTSASAPVLAGFVSLVNAARMRKGRPPIGFLNKMLYDIGAKNGSLYNDVTEGHNKCCAQTSSKAPICCATGFESTPGWDPVTGWGSMDYSAFASIFAVAAPYNGTDPSAFYTKSKKAPLELTTIDIVFLGLAVVVSIVISISAVYLCCCRKRSPSSDNVVYDNSAVFPTAAEINTENNAYAAAVAHSLSEDYTRQSNNYYVEPTLSPAGASSRDLVGVTRAYSTGMEPSPRGGELDLVPSREVHRAESAEMQRQRDIMQLLDMGFAFDIAEAALASNNWNKTRAIEQLTRSPR